MNKRQINSDHCRFTRVLTLGSKVEFAHDSDGARWCLEPAAQFWTRDANDARYFAARKREIKAKRSWNAWREKVHAAVAQIRAEQPLVMLDLGDEGCRS